MVDKHWRRRTIDPVGSRMSIKCEGAESPVAQVTAAAVMRRMDLSLSEVGEGPAPSVDESERVVSPGTVQVSCESTEDDQRPGARWKKRRSALPHEDPFIQRAVTPAMDQLSGEADLHLYIL